MAAVTTNGGRVSVLSRETYVPRTSGYTNGTTSDELQRRAAIDQIILGNSPAIAAVKNVIYAVSDSGSLSYSALITGESGTGKELIARALGQAARPNGPFVKVSCAALPQGLLESELYGHEKGAFTGAYQRKIGKFEDACSGTIFLDEIGSMPVGLQAKLLHVLQDKQFFRVGGRELLTVNPLVIAATNEDLGALLASGRFREDLYYRLNIIEITSPPLRDRVEDIPMLAHSFYQKYMAPNKKPDEGLRPIDFKPLTNYSFPGNIRELENIIMRAVVLRNTRPDLSFVNLVREYLDKRLASDKQVAVPKQVSQPGYDDGQVAANGYKAPPDGLRQIGRDGAREAEKKALKETLEQVRWNRKEAARILKVSYKTILAKIAEYGLDDS